jgi:osmotically-inducible protein OsmY
MNKLIPLLLSGVLLVGAAGCNNGADTSADAPSSTTASPTPPAASSAQDTKEDAASEVRQDQANADIRAREQRNNATGGDTDRAASDLQSEVRSKLEVNIKGSQLTVDADKDGMVMVSGTVPNEADKAKIETLAKEIKGVKSVKADQVTVAPASTKKNP